MSKIAITAILGIVRLVLKSLSYILKLVDVIRDLIDDGKVNDSLANSYSACFENVYTVISDCFDELSDFASKNDLIEL